MCTTEYMFYSVMITKTVCKLVYLDLKNKSVNKDLNVFPLNHAVYLYYPLTMQNIWTPLPSYGTAAL